MTTFEKNSECRHLFYNKLLGTYSIAAFRLKLNLYHDDHVEKFWECRLTGVIENVLWKQKKRKKTRVQNTDNGFQLSRAAESIYSAIFFGSQFCKTIQFVSYFCMYSLCLSGTRANGPIRLLWYYAKYKLRSYKPLPRCTNNKFAHTDW